MPFRRAVSPGDLYEEVRQYDLVLVPDNPLASAINRRLERPYLGPFATTPRRYAAGRTGVEDREAFLTAIERLDHDWKAVAAAVGDVIQCWEYTGSIDGILEYDHFVDDVTRAVIEVLGDEPRLTSNRLASTTVPDDRSVAVVESEQFTPLERSILPDDVEEIDLLDDEPADPPEFHIFDSKREIVNAVLSVVTPENAEHVGVMLEGDSQYSSLLEAGLEAAGIPFYRGPGFIDDPDHRAVMQLLRVGFRGSALTVGDVRPLLIRLGEGVAPRHDDRHLDSVDHPALNWITSIGRDIESYTFGELVDTYQRRTGRSLDRFEDELRGVGRHDTLVTEDRVDELSFYFDTYEVPYDRDDEGVLLADATSAGYVDRPVVFYLGMDDGWTRRVPPRPWIDTEDLAGRYLRAFEVAIQSGERQYYLVQDAAGGRIVTPCLYLSELFDEPFERFSEVRSTPYEAVATPSRTGFETSRSPVEPPRIDYLSQSRLNRFVNCPRDYLFGELIPTPDRDYFLEGTLFHDFAEVYANHPDRIDDGTIDELVEVMLDEVAAFIHPGDRPLKRTRYRIGLGTIASFLDEYSPEEIDVLTPTSGSGTNLLADRLGLDLPLPGAEHRFRNDDLRVSGTIDLVQRPDRLIDYKSGRRRRATTVVKRSAVDPPADTPDFQAILYLCHWRTVYPGQPLEFLFVHFLETLDEILTGEVSLEDAITRIRYHPVTFADWMASEEALSHLRTEGWTDCRDTFESVPLADYRDAITQGDVPETRNFDEVSASDFAADFITTIEGVASDAADPTKGAEQGLRLLNRVHRRALFRGDLDTFESFLSERLEEINRLQAGEGRYPIEGPSGEPNYRRVDHRDLLLEGTYHG